MKAPNRIIVGKEDGRDQAPRPRKYFQQDHRRKVSQPKIQMPINIHEGYRTPIRLDLERKHCCHIMSNT